MHQITIAGVLNGFVCDVGCQRVVFTSAKDLLDALEEYFADPWATAEKYIENRLPTADGPGQTAAVMGAPTEFREPQRVFLRPAEPDSDNGCCAAEEAPAPPAEGQL